MSWQATNKDERSVEPTMAPALNWKGGDMATEKKERITRGDLLRVKIADDMGTRLDRISQVYGMPPSTLAALAIGQWVAQQERTLMMTEAISNSLGEKMGDAFAAEFRQQIGLFTKDAGGDG